MAGPKESTRGASALPLLAIPILTHSQRTTFEPLGGLLALLLPGLGHLLMGRAKRGGLIFLGVMGLFLGGVLIGGIDVIDRQRDFWWFVLQAGVGPLAFVADSLHQSRFANDPMMQSLGRVNEVGSLYAGLAGLVNLIAVIDAAWPAVLSTRRTSDEQSET